VNWNSDIHAAQARVIFVENTADQVAEQTADLYAFTKSLQKSGELHS